MSQLRIAGGCAWADKLRAYRVLVDGQVAGEVREASTLVVAMTPGPHTVQLRIDWCTSPEIRVMAQPGRTLEASCGTSTRGPSAGRPAAIAARVEGRHQAPPR